MTTRTGQADAIEEADPSEAAGRPGRPADHHKARREGHLAGRWEDLCEGSRQQAPCLGVTDVIADAVGGIVIAGDTVVAIYAIVGHSGANVVTVGGIPHVTCASVDATGASAGSVDIVLVSRRMAAFVEPYLHGRGPAAREGVQ